MLQRPLSTKLAQDLVFLAMVALAVRNLYLSWYQFEGGKNQTILAEITFVTPGCLVRQLLIVRDSYVAFVVFAIGFLGLYIYAAAEPPIL